MLDLLDDAAASAAEWKNEEVLLWLEKEGFGHCLERFQAEKVDGGSLLRLSPSELQGRLQVEPAIERERLLGCLRDLWADWSFAQIQAQERPPAAVAAAQMEVSAPMEEEAMPSLDVAAAEELPPEEPFEPFVPLLPMEMEEDLGGPPDLLDAPMEEEEEVGEEDVAERLLLLQREAEEGVEQRLARLLANETPPRPSMPSAAPAAAPWPAACGLLACRPLAQACLRLREDQRPAIAEVHAALLNLARDLDLHKREAGHLHVVRAITDAMDDGRRGYLERLSLVARASEEGRSTELLRFAKERCLKSGRLESVREEDGREAQTSELPPAAAAAADGGPELPDTSRAAMLASLESHLRRWGSAAPSTACCHRHARLQLALELCGEALAGACGPPEPPAPVHCVEEEVDADACARSPAVPDEAVSARRRRASL